MSETLIQEINDLAVYDFPHLLDTLISKQKVLDVIENHVPKKGISNKLNPVALKSAIESVSGLLTPLHAERIVEAYLAALPSEMLDNGLTRADYEEVLTDHRRLVRELDVALNGYGAAQQASLCDIVAQVKSMKREIKETVNDNWGKHKDEWKNEVKIGSAGEITLWHPADRREAFEKAAKSEGLRIIRNSKDPDMYESQYTQFAWQGFRMACDLCSPKRELPKPLIMGADGIPRPIEREAQSDIRVLDEPMVIRVVECLLRVTDRFQAAVNQTPVRDMDETIAEVESVIKAMQKATERESSGAIRDAVGSILFAIRKENLPELDVHTRTFIQGKIKEITDAI